jgi:hypothetical protein
MTDALIIIAFALGCFVVLGWILRIIIGVTIAIMDRKEKPQ